MEIILTSIIAFVTTNIDDIFILVLLFSNLKYSTSEVVTGQYIGISALIGASVIGAWVGILIGPAYVGILGIIPIFIGIKSLLAEPKSKEEVQILSSNNTSDNFFIKALWVAAFTIANGGDNVSIYVPLLVSQAMAEKIVMIVIFLVFTGIWCAVAKYLTKHPMIKKLLDRYGHTVIPILFILLGIYILYENGTIALILSYV